MNIAQIGQMLLAGEYDDRTHFSFESLLTRMIGWSRPREKDMYSADAL